MGFVLLEDTVAFVSNYRSKFLLASIENPATAAAAVSSLNGFTPYLFLWWTGCMGTARESSQT